MTVILAKWQERAWVATQLGAYLLIVALFYIGQAHDRTQRETLARDTRATAIALCEQTNNHNALLRLFVREFVAGDNELSPRDQTALELADTTFANVNCTAVSPRP